VRASRVFARKNRSPARWSPPKSYCATARRADESTKRDILAACRAALPAHKRRRSSVSVAELPDD